MQRGVEIQSILASFGFRFRKKRLKSEGLSFVSAYCYSISGTALSDFRPPSDLEYLQVKRWDMGNAIFFFFQKKKMN